MKQLISLKALCQT